MEEFIKEILNDAITAFDGSCRCYHSCSDCNLKFVCDKWEFEISEEDREKIRKYIYN